MTMRILKIALLLFASGVSAHPDYSPARLVEGEESIESHIHIPERLGQGLYTVLCEGIVRADGRAGDMNCYSKDNLPRWFLEHVASAGESARFSPAMRNGSPAAVFMVWMARIYVTWNEPLVLVVPNNGMDYARYGLLYTAPQRFNEFTWTDETLALARRPTGRVLVWQKLRIDERGKVVEYDIENLANAKPAVMDAFRRQIERMEFMPGFHEGRAVPMLYAEPAFDHP